MDHAMILDCILVDDDDEEEWTSMEFRFKNTDQYDKEHEISVGTGFNRNFFYLPFLFF